MANVLVETERLRLRQFTADDADALTELDSDPEVMHFVTGGLTTPRAEITTIVLPTWIAAYARTPGLGFWAADLRATGEFLGWFHLRPGEGHPDHEPELGYRLRRAAWGHGFATEGSRALIDHAFLDLGVTCVVAETMVVHAASRRVMEKCGMRVRRTFHADWPYSIPGDEQGDVEYVIDRPTWAAARVSS